MRKLVFPFITLAALACGGDSTGPQSYADISGTYAGAMSGTTQGILMQADFTLTITQSAGSLGGSYGLTGTLTDGISTASIIGSGSITGSIAAGNSPQVTVTSRSGLCPNVTTTFSGSYDTVNRIVTLRGSIPITDTNCQVVLDYTNMVIVLTR
jgi:hypothetical protein